ncbi:trypsin-4-like [Plodia interpunctella]|uniref:trypsin-4-like n=1 Tax=Plodia interpunctella TaxID=58824 RepID=UPI00236843E2|nr:trypsin-4-like [Plodia interpunctella]
MLRKLYFVFLLNMAVKGAVGKSLNEDTSSSSEIIGGKDVDIKQYPHQIAILDDDLRFFCSGSILSENYVLTAAHCPETSNGIIHTKIRAGSSFHAEGGKIYNVLSVIFHPKRVKLTYDYDVAVLKTEKIAIDGVTTKPVKLADAGSSLEPGELVDVTGWGATANETSSNVLQLVSLPVIDFQQCQQYWNNFPVTITARMLCAGYDIPVKSACHGDSGGPLHAESSSVQYGIVSFGSPQCDTPKIPNVYTYIPAVRGWIQEVTGI